MLNYDDVKGLFSALFFVLRTKKYWKVKLTEPSISLVTTGPAWLGQHPFPGQAKALCSSGF